MLNEFYLARRYLFRGNAKHISFIGVIACLGVGVGVAALIIVISVMNGFNKDLTERLLKFNYHLVIETPESELLPKIKEKIDEIPGVKNSSVVLQTQIFAKVDRYIVPLIVKGIDFSDEAEARQLREYVKEDNKNDGFLIGEGIKDRLGLSDSIQYYPLDKTFKLYEEKIRGFFKVGIYDLDNNYVITSIQKAKNLSSNYYMFLGVRVDDPFKAEEVKNKILEELPRGLVVSPWTEYNRVLFSALKLEKLAMFVILSLIILVASFNVFATMTVKVVEKTKDIGILKALGFTSKKIMFIFSLQGLILGSIGVFIGSGLGLFLCFLLNKYSFIKLPQEIYSIDRLPVAVNQRDILLIVGLGIFLSFISSLFPAIKASRLSPCEALRYE